MKKNNLRLFLAAIMLIGLTTLQSCSKEGPAGATGAQGPAGVGNLQSKQVTINPSDWQWNSSQLSYYVDIPFDAINSTLLSNGMVYGYMDGSFDNVSGWFSLPFTKYPITNSSVYLTYEISVISLGNCRIRLIWSDGRQSIPTSSRIFRIIAITN